MPTVLEKLSETQVIELDEAVEKHGGLKEFCSKHDLNYHTVRGALSRKRAEAGGEPLDAETVEWMDAPAGPFAEEVKPNAQSVPTSCPAPLQLVQPAVPLKLSKFLYSADQHAPLHDTQYIERMCRVAYHLSVDTLVIGGDFFDNGELSRHGDDIEQADINQAVELAGEVLRFIKSNFETIHILPGNHCRRFAKRLNKNLSFRNLVKMAVGDMSGIQTTEADFFYIDTPHGKRGWTCGHPRFFAAYPTKGLDTVAMQRHRNVIGAHSHTIGLARVGEYVVVSPGHQMRADIVPYIARGDGMSKHADQVPARGFVLVESTKSDGDVVTLFGEGLTRWSDYR